ncbi:MAG: hypothetical protein AAFV96_05435, partial [Pseudomonadota bacterium]
MLAPPRAQVSALSRVVAPPPPDDHRGEGEEGEEVATAVSLPLTLSVTGPDGHLLAARSLAAVTADCTGLRACAFAATA